MKQFLFLFLVISIISCSNDLSKKNDGEGTQTLPGNENAGQTIVQNRSIVTVKLIGKEVTNEENFVLKVLVLAAENGPNYESLATPGNEYELKPAFYFDENKEIPDNEQNMGLKKLAVLNIGDEFKAEISLENLQGWVIHKVLK